MSSEVTARTPDPTLVVAEPRLGPRRDRSPVSPGVLVGVLGVVAVLVASQSGLLDSERVRAWCTMLLAIVLAATPFLVLGVMISGFIAAYVPSGAFTRLLPRSPRLSVPAAGVAGVALPGCECSSVPVTGRLIERGAPAAAALTFMLSAPAINPVVIVATFVAFPNQPEVAVARFVASLLAAVAVGLLWLRVGRAVAVRTSSPEPGVDTHRSRVWTDTAGHDFLHAGGYLVLGAALAATLQVVVPRSVLDTISGIGPVAVLALAALAVILAICSEADAFVAAGLSQFSLTARLTFLVVGPMVDIKLVALQVGTFGKAFAMRFAPISFGCAVVSAVAVATVMDL
jgi:uncharacterized protein